MSKDSKREKKNIFELIEELCPEVVEYRRLGEIAEIRTGKGITKKDMSEDGPYPIISGGKEPMGFYHENNRNGNTVTVARAGTAGYVSFMTQDFYLNDKCFSVIPKDESLYPKYLYYALKNSEEKLTSLKSKGTVPTINTAKLGAFEIPVPPLAVQREVVRVLDTMTELTTKLNAEMTARTKQYAYYRDELLELEGVEGVEYRRLGDVTTQRRGKGLKKDDKGSGNTAIILYGELYTTYGDYITDIASRCDGEVATGALPVSYGDILLPISSTTRKAQIGKASVLKVSEPVYMGGDAVALTPKDCILSDYLMYCINGKAFEEQKMKCVKGTTIQHLNPSMMYDIEIPIPPLPVQQDIVTKLDAFSSYCTDLTSGLPAEIAAREKQYAYYRDLLLSFQPAQHSLF